MVLIRVPKTWAIPEGEVTAETAFLNRRRFLKTLVGVGVSATTLPLLGCQQSTEAQVAEAIAETRPLNPVRQNPDFAAVDRPITHRVVAATYNNFYEFGGTKSGWQDAQALPTRSWRLEVSGLVKNPKTYDLDDLYKTFPLEERIYRFRCVEAWSMVLPWTGFPMRSLLATVEPTAKAKFVRFTSYYNPKIMTGPVFHLGPLPWPYTEGLRLEEMANELAFFAVGIYGHTLPKQHGAPIRAVIPWKYGFKGAKSIVKIEFTDQQPATFWNTVDSYEYGFEANVNPTVPHPRWSQATEKFIGPKPEFSVERRPTLPYNGYGEYVAALYSGAGAG